MSKISGTEVVAAHQCDCAAGAVLPLYPDDRGFTGEEFAQVLADVRAELVRKVQAFGDALGKLGVVVRSVIFFFVCHDSPARRFGLGIGSNEYIDVSTGQVEPERKIGTRYMMSSQIQRRPLRLALRSEGAGVGDWSKRAAR